jgi:hypothetical protein
VTLETGTPAGRVEDAPDDVHAHTPGVTEAPETLASLRKARSLLVLLLATCHETLLALEAAANVLDTQLTADLMAMIERSEAELHVLNDKIKEFAETA